MLTIASALIRRSDEICLVQQQGRHDAMPAWMLPGGKVEPDEVAIAGLRREVAEETGLLITGNPEVAFVVDTAVSGTTYRAITFVCEADGELSPADPDGIILRAEWVPIDEAIRRLTLAEWYDTSPLRRYLEGEAAAGTTYRLNLP